MVEGSRGVWMGLGLGLVAALIAPEAMGQQARPAPVEKKAVDPLPLPTWGDVEYGPHARNVLDFWEGTGEGPRPLLVYIHGGGWTAGDKTSLKPADLKRFLDAGISVAAINYRLIQNAMAEGVEPPVDAPLKDAARAVQFLRSKAKEWNIDPTRVGATGGSAGACTSLWLAFHDDLADPKSADPVARESTRLTCAAVVGAQTSLDPVVLKPAMPNIGYGGHAFGYRAEGRSRPQEFAELATNRDKHIEQIKEYSPDYLVSPGDPEVFLDYPGQDKEPVFGEEQKDPTHSAVYGLILAEQLIEDKVPFHLTYPGHKDPVYAGVVDFLIRKLGGRVETASK